MQILSIVTEGAAQAFQQLLGNKLRSFLSLLGVTIGIFCIIGVKSAVDSLEENIRNSMSKLGNDVVYIEKFSWAEDPGDNYWKWMKRPSSTYGEYLKLREKLDLADKVGYWMFLGLKTVKFQSSNVEQSWLIGCTEDCNDLFHLEFQGEGRFFSQLEYGSGSEVCILGNKIAEGIFGERIDPTGKEVTIGGKKLRIVGVLKASGKDLLKPFNFDSGVMIGMNLARRGFSVRTDGKMVSSRSSLIVQAREGVSVEALKDELMGVFRSIRSLKPSEEDNFALNTLSILSDLFDTVFTTINKVGFFIGVFALIVGAFSVANIMFVSVKERTSIIGIKMALGAKRWFILLEILIEAITLCITGGIFGLILIFLLTLAVSNFSDFKLTLSIENILFGLITSLIVGVISGIIPAYQASGMDPVEAIRK